MVKMVVFDMAGTTVNEQNVVYKTLQKVVNEAGFSASLEDVLLLGAGKEKLQAIKDVIKSQEPGNYSDELANQIYSKFMVALNDAYHHLEVSTFDQTVSVFDYLHQKDIKIVLNTGYNRPIATSLIEKLNWQEGKEFDLLITADDVSNGRPAPDMIHLAMEKLEVNNPEQIVKIGDSQIDIEEGKAANCGMTIGVTTGAQTEEQLKDASPDFVIHSLVNLKSLV